ncbi:VCBS repeat-containing protein [Actinoplanes sp. KI2]|uniref:FG-GAP repeat domain-containing protein n=1 Tax=Actinoplanes sp. KI2 TaxID=2983315 RepID=UPI0021D5DFBC|nr:VCBS repeat-containing protein [Actinoplanes sp. KI2]MCU7723813.1 VCBS repeat-containing protein [Actinoplanes sp. KI2]
MSRGAAMLGAAALLAGTFCLATPAQAAIPYAPCQPGGPAAADNVTAAVLRPSMTGVRLGRSVTGYSISCARAIVANVQARGLNQRAAVIAVAAAIAESSLHNYTVAVDADSLGLFQQRPSQGWGQPGELTDPRYSTQAFLSAMIRKDPGNGWMSGDIGEICQRVQASAYPEAYAPEVHDAQLIVADVWGRTAAPAATQARQPTGPFQKVLMAAATGWGQTDDRHAISVADWNDDRRPDLVVVQHAATATGRTEIYIFDGTPSIPGAASSFQRLLRQTATPLDLSAGNTTTYAMADWNGDGWLDLVAIQKAGTASGRTEVRILDGATSFQTFLVQTVTALGPTDARHDMLVADMNGDNVPDLVVVYQADTASGKTEVQVLDGASGFQRELQHSVTALGPTDARHEFSIADWNGDGRPDLVDVQRSGTKSRKTEIRVLDGAKGFGSELRKTTATALGPTDDRTDLSFADWNGDGRLDLVAIQKSGTATGRMEARVLSGA